MDNKMFEGFSKDSIAFLKELIKNNNKQWFESHKSNYEALLLTPLKYLVSDLGDFMLLIDNLFEVAPSVNKTISRIYRDTRFSHDKSPYKTSFWITFKRPQKDWKDAPAYFFEISPESYRFGMGFYDAMPKTMEKFREFIDNNQKEFQKAILFYSKQKMFVLEGDKYKKIIDPKKPNDIQDWYQRKNFYLVCNRKIDNALFSKQLTEDLILGFDSLSKFYQYLLQIKQ